MIKDSLVRILGGGVKHLIASPDKPPQEEKETEPKIKKPPDPDPDPDPPDDGDDDNEDEEEEDENGYWYQDEYGNWCYEYYNEENG